MVLQRISRKLTHLAQARQHPARNARPFSERCAQRLLLVTLDHRIPQSQIFPFHYYRDAIRTRFDAELREVFLDDFLAGADVVKGATTVCFQTTYEADAAMMARIDAQMRRLHPGARLVYLDWFAPSDLRFAELMDAHVDLYVKKHLLRDRALYGRETYGDTNLMDHFGRRFGLDHTPQRFAIPPGFLDKLHPGPSFATASFVLPRLEDGPPPETQRPFDLHARLQVAGSPWYQAMRAECEGAVAALKGVSTVSGIGVRHDQFLNELTQSKICFSPFGYGEVCWRDYEAVMCGAVLLKQDMSHIETDPDIFRAGETYVPLRWDLADLQVKVEDLLANPSKRAEIATNAFAVLRDYARDQRFLDQIAPFFEDKDQAIERRVS